MSTSQGMESATQVVQTMKPDQFVGKLMKLTEKPGRKSVSIGVLDSEKATLKGRRVRFADEAVLAHIRNAVDNKNIQEAMSIFLTHVRKGNAVIEEKGHDGAVKAIMTRAIAAKMAKGDIKRLNKQGEVKPYEKVHEVSEEEFQKLASALSVTLKISLDDKKSDSNPSEQATQTQDALKTAAKTQSPPQEKAASTATAGPTAPAKKEEPKKEGAPQALQDEMRHVEEGRKKAEDEKELEHAAEILKKEEVKQQKKEDAASAEVKKEEQKAAEQKSSPAPTAEPLSVATAAKSEPLPNGQIPATKAQATPPAAIPPAQKRAEPPVAHTPEKPVPAALELEDAKHEPAEPASQPAPLPGNTPAKMAAPPEKEAPKKEATPAITPQATPAKPAAAPLHEEPKTALPDALTLADEKSDAEPPSKQVP